MSTHWPIATAKLVGAATVVAAMNLAEQPALGAAADTQVWWRMNGSVNTYASAIPDSSIYGRTGAGQHLFFRAPGYDGTGTAVAADRTDLLYPYVVLSADTDLGRPSETSPFKIELRFNTDGAFDNTLTIGADLMHYGSAVSFWYHADSATVGTFQLQIAGDLNGGAVYALDDSSQNVGPGTGWHDAMIEYDGTQVSASLDGQTFLSTNWIYGIQNPNLSVNELDLFYSGNYGFFRGGKIDEFVFSIPEPSTGGLLLAGGLAILLRRRR